MDRLGNFPGGNCRRDLFRVGISHYRVAKGDAGVKRCGDVDAGSGLCGDVVFRPCGATDETGWFEFMELFLCLACFSAVLGGKRVVVAKHLCIASPTVTRLFRCHGCGARPQKIRRTFF